MSSPDVNVEVALPRGPGIWRAAVWGAGAVLGTLAVANAVVAQRARAASHRLGGVFARYPARHGDIAYAVKGSGPPVLLLHALRPGFSMAEWERNFQVLSHSHTVYALDFPAYGLSGDVSHGGEPQILIEIIQNFTQDIIGEPCALVASGESGPLAVVAAWGRPDLFSRLALICPSSETPLSAPTDATESLGGLTGQSSAASAERLWQKLQSWREALCWRAFTLPIIGSSLVLWRTSMRQLEREARERGFWDKSLADGAWLSQMHAASHGRRARDVVASSCCGSMRVEWRAAWSQIELPSLLIWGRNAPGQGIASAPEWLALQTQARLEIVDLALLLPHIERADIVNALLLRWLGGELNL